MPNVEHFLKSLAKEAGRSLSAKEAADLVGEARDHLELGIKARLELGMSEAEAEREALAAFGATSEVAKEIRNRNPRFDRDFTLSTMGIVGFMLWAINVGPMGPVWFAWLGVYAVLHVAYLVTSFRARRPQLLIFPILLLPLWAGISVWLSTQNVTVRDVPNAVGSMSIGRDGAVKEIARLTASAEQARQVPKEMVTGYTRYMRGESDLAPGKVASFNEGVVLRVKPELDRTVGEAHWQNALVNGIRMVSRRSEEEFLRAELLKEAAVRPWWAEIPYQLIPAFEKMALDQLLLLYGGGHLLFWSLGVLSRRRRARRESRSTA